MITKYFANKRCIREVLYKSRCFLHRWSGVYMGPGLQGPAGSGGEAAQHQIPPTPELSVSGPPGAGRCRGGAELRPLCLWSGVQLGQQPLWAARPGRHYRYMSSTIDTALAFKNLFILFTLHYNLLFFFYRQTYTHSCSLSELEENYPHFLWKGPHGHFDKG